MSEPVFVVSGAPRSGTSLAMALLKAGGIPLLADEARGADDDNPLGYHEFEPVKRLPKEADWLEAAGGRAVKVIHALLPALPPGPTYRVILMRRDLEEVVLSQDRMLARRAAAPGQLGVARVMELLAAQLEETRAWLRARPRIAWMELDYNGHVNEPEPGLSQLVAFAGLRASLATLEATIRPSLYRCRATRPNETGPTARATGPSDRS